MTQERSREKENGFHSSPRDRGKLGDVLLFSLAPTGDILSSGYIKFSILCIVCVWYTNLSTGQFMSVFVLLYE